MQVTVLHILSLVIKTSHILFLFSVCKSFRLLSLDLFLEMYCLKRPLYEIIYFLILLQWISDSNYNKAKGLKNLSMKLILFE